MITDEQKLSLLQMGIKNSETFDEAHDIADFIFGNDEEPFTPIVFSNHKSSTSCAADKDTKPQSANAKDNDGPKENGLYIVYIDGTYERYTGENTVRGKVRGIGIKYYDNFFTVSLEDVGYQPLFKHSRSDNDPHVVYHPYELSALTDWNCLSNDSGMKLNGITFELPPRMFVPTLAQLALIGYHVILGELNEALKLVGGEPIYTATHASAYCSSTEADQFYVWGINMNKGRISRYYSVAVCLSVRPIYI